MEAIKLADHANIDSLIEGATFNEAVLLGPAVIAPLEDVRIEDCRFDADPESLFIVIPEGQRVVGVIGVRNSTFRRCRFENIAIAGTTESVEVFKRGFTPPPQIVPMG